jgi:hypothetical protein
MCPAPALWGGGVCFGLAPSKWNYRFRNLVGIGGVVNGKKTTWKENNMERKQHGKKTTMLRDRTG